MTDERIPMTHDEIASHLETMASTNLDEAANLRVLAAFFIDEDTERTFLQFYVSDTEKAARILIAQEAAGLFAIAAHDMLRDLLSDD